MLSRWSSPPYSTGSHFVVPDYFRFVLLTRNVYFRVLPVKIEVLC